VTPNPVPFALSGVVSRKTHAGITFDLPIDTTKPITDAITVEPRIDSSHRVVFQFTDSVTSFAGLVVTGSDGTAVGSVGSAVSGREVILTLTGVDARRVRVLLTGVNEWLNASASVGFLAGDENASGSVTASDILRIKGRVGQAAGSATFLYDVTLDAAVTVADQTAAKARTGTSLR
jgi:hypothetical protein